MASSSLARILTLALAATASAAAGWPDLSGSGPIGPARPDDAALVVALSDYHELPDIPHAVADTSLFADWLTTGAGLRRGRVVRLIDPDCATLERNLRTFARMGAVGGRLWLHLVGHGGHTPKGEPALLCIDHDPDSEHHALLPLAGLTDALRGGAAAEVIIVLDASLSGHAHDGLRLPGQPSVERARLPTVPGMSLLAASIDGPAPTLEEPGHGALTWLMVGGLRGWADAHPADHRVTLSELRSWLRDAYAQQALPVSFGITLDPGHRDTILSARATQRTPELPEPASRITPQDRMNDGWRAARGSIVAQAYAHADADWLRAATRGRGGRDAGRAALLSFLARYDGLSYPFDDGEIRVVVPQVAEAHHRLSTWGEPWRPWIATVRLDRGAHDLGDEQVTLPDPVAFATHESSTALLAALNPRARETGTSAPALGLSWREAVRACNTLSEAQGLPIAVRFDGREPIRDPASKGWRLPTLDEWRAAAGQPEPAPRFDRPVAACATANLRDAGSHPEDEEAWLCHDGFSDAAPIGALPANARGIHELIGNAAEWVWDADAEGRRWLVGGSYRTRPDTTEPRALRPDEKPSDAGFRCVRTLSEP